MPKVHSVQESSGEQLDTHESTLTMALLPRVFPYKMASAMACIRDSTALTRLTRRPSFDVILTRWYIVRIKNKTITPPNNDIKLATIYVSQCRSNVHATISWLDCRRLHVTKYGEWLLCYDPHNCYCYCFRCRLSVVYRKKQRLWISNVIASMANWWA